MCVASLITWCNPNWDVKFLIAAPSRLALSLQNHLLNLPKSLRLPQLRTGSFALNFLNLIQGVQ